MDSNVELINEAIKKLLEEKKNNRGGEDDDDKDDQILLSRLLSQLESLKEADSITHRDDVTTNTSGGGGGEGSGERDDELAKELREVRRQNTITHWMLSVLIVLTVAWQASEVTMLLKVKQGLSNPFKYVGSLVGGMFKGGSGDLTPLEARDKHHQKVQNDVITALKMPELPSVELPDIGLNGEKH